MPLRQRQPGLAPALAPCTVPSESALPSCAYSYPKTHTRNQFYSPTPPSVFLRILAYTDTTTNPTHPALPARVPFSKTSNFSNLSPFFISTYVYYIYFHPIFIKETFFLLTHLMLHAFEDGDFLFCVKNYKIIEYPKFRNNRRLLILPLFYITYTFFFLLQYKTIFLSTLNPPLSFSCVIYYSIFSASTNINFF